MIRSGHMLCLQLLKYRYHKTVAYSLPALQLYGSFRKLGVPYFGVLIIRILLFPSLRVCEGGKAELSCPGSPQLGQGCLEVHG